MKAYAFLANGFEEIEALAPIDILRRADVEVVTVSINPSLEVEGAHGVTVLADTVWDMIETQPDGSIADADMLFLPGGMPGASNLFEHEPLCAALKSQAASGKLIAAICAAPFILGELGILDGHKATCYPGFESHFPAGVHTADHVTVSGNILTGEGPGAAMELGYAMLEALGKADAAQQLRNGMRFIC